MTAVAELLEHLPSAKKETSQIDFKSSFDPASKQDWCEIVKDLVAMANTRGGILAIGVNDDATPSSTDISHALKLDPAQITDKVASYTGVQFSRFEIKHVAYCGQTAVVILIRRSEVPLVFIKPGTYPVTNEKVQQKTAFAQGTIYFRHGAKSEPGTTDDLRKFIERRIELASRTWKKNIRRVINAPAGHKVRVVPPNMKIVPSDEAAPVRLVNDPDAPVSKFVNPDETHPFRQKELLVEVCRRLDGNAKPTSHDILCVRRVHAIDQNPNFAFYPKFGSPQYSPAFADWLAQEYAKDPGFFSRACNSYRERRVKKPR
jgi:hypothetical protein